MKIEELVEVSYRNITFFFKEPLPVFIEEGETYIFARHTIIGFGVGNSEEEALADFACVFGEVWKEYVDSEDPMTPDAWELRETLLHLVERIEVT